jgi:integrase
VKLSDIGLLLDACSSVQDKLIVSILADTGLRISELVSVARGDIDATNGTIRVWGKGAKQRVVRYGPRTAEFLATWIAQSFGPLLIKRTYSSIESMLRRLRLSTGTTCNPHAFRRTFACESVRNGLNLFYVQSLLGHSTLQMTRLYAEQVNSEDAIKHYKPIVQ